MDCSKDFYGEEHKTHIKCISEEEKYSAKGWTPKPNQNKNERKQSEWVEMVQSLVNTAQTKDPSLARVLQTISNHENIPRKKPKFMNFLKNIFGNRGNHEVAEKAWNVISKALDDLRAKANNPPEPLAKVADVVKIKPENGTKRKPSDEEEPEYAENTPKKKKSSDFEESSLTNNAEKEQGLESNKTRVKWCSLGKIILRAQDDKEMPLKKFQKKIIAEYLSRLGNPSNDVTVEVLWASCLKKLSKNPKFKIHKERIKIVT